MNQENKKINILVVDDDASLREIYTQKLVNEGFEVMIATNGVEAVDAIKANFDKLDLVLLDVVMPKMDGFDVLEKMKGSWGKLKKMPIIMLTSLSDPEDRQRAMELGADAFFVKPDGTPTDLAEKIKEILTEKAK